MKKRQYKLLIDVVSYSCIGLLGQFLFVSLCLAHDAGAQKAKSVHEVSIRTAYDQASLADVFSDIESKTAFVFTFDNKDTFLKDRYTKAAGKTTVADILKDISHSSRLIFQQINNNISVRKQQADEKGNTPAIILGAAFNVTGTVTAEEDGGGLPGVNVLVKGSDTGTVTDIAGQYSINVADENDTLIFSSIGFMIQEVPISGRSVIDVALSEDIQSLEEVVVTALGISREKAALPYAVTEVKGETFTKARENNLGNALSGRIAGVNATSTATGPSGSSRVIIRGNGSLNGDNQPLYVVNGMPIDNTNQGSPGTYGGIDRGDGLLSINPDDIESISVLKGGTAAALYGSRAANGVILITTKSGMAQQGIGVEFNSTYTLEAPRSLPDWQYQYGSGSRGVAPTTQAEAIANGRISWGAPLDGSMVIQPDGESRPYVAQKDNIQNFYNTGKTFSNTLALNGGNETANFRFSVSNMDNSGIVPGNTVNRKTFNLSANATLAKKVVFQGKAQYNIEETENRPYTADFTLNPNAGAQLIATNIDVRTLSPGYGEDGFETPWSDYIYSTNPYFAINKARNGDERRRFIGSFSTQYNITEAFYARARMGIDYFNLNGYNITPTGTAFNNRGSMDTNQNTTSETNVEAILGYNKNFGSFSVNAIVGGNQMHNSRSGVNLNSGFFNVPFQYFIGNGSSQTFSQEFRETAINSLFASADIGFNNYLYLSLTGRQDWFSTLPKASNSLFYPSVGLSFVFSDAWDSKPSWLDHGKIRTSWAQVGGGAPDPYGLGLRYSAQAVPHLGQPLMEISGETIPNSLKPYTSTTYEMGIELKAFDNRLGADITLYNRTTTDDIVNASIPISSSYNSVALNVGEMQNRGIELMLSGMLVSSQRGFNWDASFNMAYNQNEVLKIADGLEQLYLPGATTRTLNGWIYHFEGMPFGMIAGYRPMTNDDGQIVYNSANGLPLQSELMPLGRGVPPLTMGLNNNITYKNFALGFLLDGKFGAKIYSATNAYGTFYGLDQRTVENNVREEGVSVSGVNENGEAYTESVPAQTYYQGTTFSITDQFVTDADFIKLRQLTFGYSFPNRLLDNTPFQSASLSFVARNLFLLYNQARNIDPESGYSNSNAQGLENFGVPTARSFGFNLNVRF
ncbi:MAG: SusC/RagA family TonB-linked outer membrane protein [Cyclobacteriaceae bacterium]